MLLTLSKSMFGFPRMTKFSALPKQDSAPKETVVEIKTGTTMINPVHYGVPINPFLPRKFITTGSKALDWILGEGIEIGVVTEIFVTTSVGKSQLAFTLCITGQLPVSMGGGEGSCVYIDIENTFGRPIIHPQRLSSIANRFGMDQETASQNVAVGRALHSKHLERLLIETTAMMANSKFAVLIVDGGITSFVTDYFPEAPEEGLNQFRNFLKHLERIAVNNDCAVVMINPSGYNEYMLFADIVAATPSIKRVVFGQISDSVKVARIVNPVILTHAPFSTTEGGITDVNAATVYDLY